MNKNTELDWQAIRTRARSFSEDAFQFVRDGLAHTVKAVHGKPVPKAVEPGDESRHVNGRQLCQGLRDLAIERYGLLARAVLRHWGITRTEDFGTIVYSMIDRGELRSSTKDTMEDFRGVFEFDSAFPFRLG